MVSKINGSTSFSNRKLEPFEPVAKHGRMRHILAVLALSAFVMAYINRQAYNQGLARMVRKARVNKPALPEAERQNSVNITWPQTTSASALPINDFVELAVTSPGSFPDTLDATTSTSLTSETTTNSNNNNERADELGDEEEDDRFDWTNAQVSMLQAAFSYGYTPFMIPGGRLSEIYGAKWVIFLSSFGSAVCSFVTPLFADHSVALLVAMRIFMGICQTGVSPAMYAFCSRWLPPDEASVYLPMIKVGVMFGLMLGSGINAVLPWRTMFYVIGLIGIAWSVVWAIFASSDPEDNKFLHEQELAYIQKCLKERQQDSSAATAAAKQQTKSDDREASRSSAPWFGILTNPVVLAFTFTKFTVKLSTDTQSIQIPMYMRQVFSMSDGLNGFLNGCNFAIQAMFTGAVAYTAKEMVVNKKFGLNKTGVRILFQSINCFGMGLAYLLISFNMGSLNLVCFAVIILSISSMFGAGGEAVLPIDLTTEYSASIMAIANSAANLSGIVLPPMVSFFLEDQRTSSHHWNKVWWFISALMTCGGLMFACVVEAKIQDFHRGNRKTVYRDGNAQNKEAPRGQVETTKGKVNDSKDVTISIPNGRVTTRL